MPVPHFAYGQLLAVVIHHPFRNEPGRLPEILENPCNRSDGNLAAARRAYGDDVADVPVLLFQYHCRTKIAYRVAARIFLHDNVGGTCIARPTGVAWVQGEDIVSHLKLRLARTANGHGARGLTAIPPGFIV